MRRTQRAARLKSGHRANILAGSEDQSGGCLAIDASAIFNASRPRRGD
jgi:hypothetical protein